MYAGATRDMIAMVSDLVWEVRGTPGDEEKLKKETVVVSVSYNLGKPVIRYVSPMSVWEGSQKVPPTLEDAYIYILGGIKR